MPLALSVALVETGCADFVVLSVNPRESPAGGILWDRTLKALCAVPDAEQVRRQCRWPQETGRGALLALLHAVMLWGPGVGLSVASCSPLSTLFLPKVPPDLVLCL